MNTYAKILATTLPLVLLFLLLTVGTAFNFSRTALTDLAETWLKTRLTEAMKIVAEQENVLHEYGLEEISASIAKAKIDASTALSAIEVRELGYVFAVDANGVIVIHPDVKMIGKRVSQAAWFQAMRPGQDRLTFTNQDGRNLALYDYFDPWKWYVIAVDPEKEVYGAADRMKPYLFYLGILGAIVIALALMLLSRRLTAPLRSLIVGVDRIGRGDLKTRIRISSRDEFGHLAQVFNQMATQLQKSLTTIKNREEHFRSLIENSSDIITVLDADGIITYESPSIERILGYRGDELIGKPFIDLVHPQDQKDVKRRFDRQVQSIGAWASIEVRIKHRDGTWRTIEATNKNLMDHPAVSGIVVNSRDISVRKRAEAALQKSHAGLEKRVAARTAELTSANEQLLREIEERRQAETALQKSEQRLQAILRASPVGVGLVAEGKLIWANQTLYRLAGYDQTDLVGKDSRVLYADHQEYKRVVNVLNDKTSRSEIGEVKTQWARRDGTLFDCEIRAYALDADDHSKGLIMVVTDISNATQLEMKLQRSRKMEALGTLAGGVAHDLNNILSGIVSYPELLLMDIEVNSPLRKPIETIQKSGERAATIVQDLLTMARRGVAVTEAVNLNHLVHDQLKRPEFKTLKRFHPEVNTDLALEEGLLNINGSEAHLSKSIMNLISNAAEAMPDGGLISVQTANVYLDKPLRGYEEVEEGEYVVLTVSDTGVGIPEADLERIFEPFYTKKKMGRSGSGLGMAVVWGTVKDHNGYIDVCSTEGQGAKFSLYFPVTRMGMVAKQAELSMDAYHGQDQSILVVDDSQVQRQVATSMLVKLGYRASSVPSGEDAVAYVKETPVDLLVLDMLMDPGMDGLDTYRQIVDIYPQQKAIIASGFSETERVAEAQRLGAGPYIKKPYTIGKIGVVVREELAKKK